jgi:hypothetical protein
VSASRSEPFADLPDALVRDLLAVAIPVGDSVRQRIERLRESAGAYREQAKQQGLVKRKADLERPREPSVAGIDGSYQIHSLTSIDLCATAAIAVEGTSKEAKRHWPEPYHYMWAGGVPHAIDTTGVLRGLMVSLELRLASDAPHDIVMLDGAFASLVIYLNQGLADMDVVPEELGAGLRKAWFEEELFERLLRALRSERLIALPKFTGRNELVGEGRLTPAEGFDGRTLATVVLEPGEYTTPLPTHVDDAGQPQAYHLPKELMGEDGEADRRLNAALQEVRVTYFRPYGWVPALRIELPGPVANSESRLALALEGVQSQFFTPAVVEPYPLFLADRMVKSLGAGVSVVEQTVAQHVADEGADIELTMLCLQQHRTQGGRGGV